MNSVKKAASLIGRNISRSVPLQGCNEIVPKGFARMKAKQKKFQIDNNLPVFLKGGAKDKMLYQFNILLILGMTVHSIYILFNLAKPKA